MDEVKKTVLIDVQSNFDSAQAEAVKYAKDIEELKKQIKDLKNADGDNAEQIELTKAKLRESQKAYREATKSMDDTTRANAALEGSYAELQAQLRIAEKDLKNQAGLLTQNADGTIILSDSYIEASKKVENARNALNTFNQGIKNGSTNVGLYQQSIEKAFGNVRIFGMGIQDLSGTMSGGFLNAIKGSIQGLAAFGKALLANPITIVLAAIAGAVVLIKKAWESFAGRYTETMDKIGAVTASLGVMFDAFVDRIVNLGRNIGNVIKYITTLGKEGSLSFEKIEGSIMDAGKAMYELELQQKRLNDQMKEFELQSDKANLKIKELEEIYKDVTKTDAERLSAAQEAMNLEMERAEQEKQLQEENLRIIKEKNTLSKSGRADREAEIEAERKVIAAQTRSFQTRIRITATLSKLENDLIKEKEDAARKEEALAMRNLKARLEIRKIQGKDDLSAMREILTEERDLELRNTELTEQEKLLINEKYRAAFLALDKQEKLDLQKQQSEHDAIMRGLIEAEQARNVADYRERKAARIQQKDDLLKLRQLELEEQRALNTISLEQDYENSKSILQRQRELALQDRTLTETQREIIIQEFRNRELQLDQDYTDAKKQISNERIQQFQNEVAMYADALGLASEIAGKETAAGKAFAVAQATINTYLAASKALATFAGNPIAATIAVASAIAAGLLQVKKILAVQVPGQSSGGGSSPSSSRMAAMQTSNQTFSNAANTNTTSNNQNNTTKAVQETSTDIAEAIKNMPAPVLYIDEFEKKQTNKNKVETKANY